MSITIVYFVVLPIINPLRRPNTFLRAYLLNLMPVGTHISEVHDIVDERMRWRGGVSPWGVALTPSGPSWGPPRERDEEIGAMSMRVSLGQYFGFSFVIIPSERILEAAIAFDADGYLLDIFIRRSHP